MSDETRLELAKKAAVMCGVKREKSAALFKLITEARQAMMDAVREAQRKIEEKYGMAIERAEVENSVATQAWKDEQDRIRTIYPPCDGNHHYENINRLVKEGEEASRGVAVGQVFPRYFWK